MPKRIISQARGKGGPAYRVSNAVFKYRMTYPARMEGEGEVIKFVTSASHTAPIAKIKWSKGIFFIPAFKGMELGQKIKLNTDEIKDGNVIQLKNLQVKTPVYMIESRNGDGGKFVKTGGTSAEISKFIGQRIFLRMPSKQEKEFEGECRAIVGTIAGHGRLDKPIVKAGKNFYIKKLKQRLWPRTSAIKVNALDHPFGSGRGKNPKPKIAKRNAPAGARVGTIRPRRTGYRK